jgi:outer membrane protein assembly factor BamB
MMPDGVYLVVDSKCMVFAPDTGRELNTFPFLIEKQVATGLRVTDDIILIACTLTEIDATRAVLHNYLGDVSSTLVCLDRRTGAELWRRKAAERFDDKALAVGKGMVFVTDSLPLYLADKAAAKPEDVKQLPSTILALDARTGAEQWSKTISYDSTRTLTQDDHVSGVDDGHIQKPYGRDWLSYVPETDMVVAGRFFVGSGFEARTGKPRWEQKEIRGTAPMVVRGKTIVTSGGRVYDALTGNLTTHYPGVRKVACNYAVASKHLIMIRLNNASYYDVAEDKSYQLRNIRSSCMNNLIAADGLVNSPCFTPGDCNCNFPIQTSFALLNMPEVDEWAGSTPLTMPTPPPRTPPPQAQPAATGK